MSQAATATDTRVSVAIPADGLTASVRLQGPIKGKPLKAEEVAASLTQQDVCLDDSVHGQIDKFLDAVKRGEGADTFVVARGTPPQAAQSERLVWTDDFQQTADEWSKDAPNNFYETRRIVLVAQGDVIGTIAPAVQAVDGVDVRGHRIGAEGSPETLTLGSTITRESNDTSKLVAASAGEVVERNHHIDIEPAAHVAGDVDLEVGHVATKLSLRIDARVCDRFAVRSEGSVTVGAAVEAARVETGGHLIVRGGIIGRRMGLVDATLDVVAKYASDAQLLVGGDLKIVNQLLNCHTCVEGSVIAPKASVIGGSLYVRGGAEVVALGSEAQVPTHVAMGVDPHAVREIALIDRRVQAARDRIERFREMIEPVLNGKTPSTTEQKKRAETMMADLERLSKKAAEDEQHKADLLEQVFIDGEPILKVDRMIFGRTSIRIGDRETVFHDDFPGPTYVERRKIKNVTEIVTVDPNTGRVKVLSSERYKPEELLEAYDLEKEWDAQGKR